MTMSVQTWWIVLCIVAVMNIAAWFLSAATLARRHDQFFWSAQHQQQRWMLWLSAAYVAGCSFRSFLPRIDLERVCLLQSALSNMMVGRSVATVAELCFMAQGALLLYHAGNKTGIKFVTTVSLLLIPIIAVAECASWYAILLEKLFWTRFRKLYLDIFCNAVVCEFCFIVAVQQSQTTSFFNCYDSLRNRLYCFHD